MPTRMAPRWPGGIDVTDKRSPTQNAPKNVEEGERGWEEVVGQGIVGEKITWRGRWVKDIYATLRDTHEWCRHIASCPPS